MLAQDKLKELLAYNMHTGVFTWRVYQGASTAIGKEAGCINSQGYVVIRVQRTLYLAHRLAILFVKGYFPAGVDHIDNIKANNSYKNLRECSQRANNCNVRTRKDNTSGVKGICFVTRKMGGSSYYSAYVAGQSRRVNKTFTLSRYPSKEEALVAATLWVQNTREQLHGDFTNHG